MNPKYWNIYYPRQELVPETISGIKKAQLRGFCVVPIPLRRFDKKEEGLLPQQRFCDGDMVRAGIENIYFPNSLKHFKAINSSRSVFGVSLCKPMTDIEAERYADDQYSEGWN